MNFSRYRNDSLVRGGQLLGSNEAMRKLRLAHRRGHISVEKRVLKEGGRLDHIANELYGDGRLWWVIAICSGIGWWLQCPPGTLVEIPIDLREVINLV